MAASQEVARKHLVRSFDDDMNELTGRITEMGGIAERQLADAVRALVERDAELAGEVIERDKSVDELEEEIDQLVIRLLATRQPMAIDLRVIAMALKISNDLERSSDYAKGIAKRAIRLADQPQLKPLITIPLMAQTCEDMLTQVLDAYVERDADKAMEIWRRDAEVDAIYDSLFRELLTYIIEDPRRTQTCIDILFVAKNLERIGDHATNIAEKIHYMIHGAQINRARKGGQQEAEAK
ncbi:MAG TPA: phosphate signaling complex protein PhoU [Geminicoccaceae bacterium]|nr:phosphate signaling complex protein PhoU [Geminicoccus sp.]HMU52125.1 phosphate signaling complex protein PhoU [Geminicoccaceae bacterium]